MSIHYLNLLKNSIFAAYANDMAKHAGKETERIRMVWKSIPAQLSKENKKFIYGTYTISAKTIPRSR